MVRRQATLLAALAALLAWALLGCVHAAPVTPPERAPATVPTSETAPPAPIHPAPTSRTGRSAQPRTAPSPVRLVSATVVRVVDGDTAVMRLASDRVERVRFIGVDTPESTTQHEPYGKEASRFTEARIEGRRVFLQVGTEPRDRYGRLLAYVWLARPKSLRDSELRSKLFDAQLLIQGYAQLMTIPPNVDYVESFRRYQAEAREQDRGLWGLTTERPD